MEQLFTVVYGDLRRIAQKRISGTSITHFRPRRLCTRPIFASSINAKLDTRTAHIFSRRCACHATHPR
jgi:hypothetical protein